MDADGKARSRGGKRVRAATEGRRNPAFLNPVCPRCGERRVCRNGTSGGRQMFRCQECGRCFTGEIPKAEPFPCPYCGGACQRKGLSGRRTQEYRCMVCGRYNTRLWPHTPAEAGGPFRHSICFHLDKVAWEGLECGCQMWGRSMAQAIRYVLIIGTEGDYLPTVEEAIEITAGRWETTDVYGIRYRSPYLTTMPESRYYTVRLNDRALQGLAVTMRIYDLTRQEALRWLLRRVRRGDFG